jgi:hypothetical protein
MQDLGDLAPSIWEGGEFRGLRQFMTFFRGVLGEPASAYAPVKKSAAV